MNKKLLTLMLGMFLLVFTLSGISASTSNLGTYERNTNVNLVQVTSAYDSCNITSVKYPNSTKAIGEVSMDKDGYEFNYTFKKTGAIGNYQVNGFCTDSNTTETFNYYFDVTSSGGIFDNSKAKTYGYSLLVMLAFSALFFIISTTFKDKDDSGVNKKNRSARFFFIALSFVTAVIAVLFVMTTLQTVMPEFSGIISGFSTFHYIILGVLFVLFIFIMINITFKLLEDMKAKSGKVPGRFNPYRQGKRNNPGKGFGG